MSRHRSEYRKAVLTSGLIALGCFIALGWLLGGRLATRESWPPLSWALWLVGCIVLLGGAALCSLAIAGGLIALHRDALEARGLPYPPKRPLEWRAGPLVRSLRKGLRRLRAIKGRRPGQLDLRPGEPVIVRPIDEIMETLDEQGLLDGLPFMPEMEGWCGRPAYVLRRVDKVLDWIHGTGLRRMCDTVYLEGSRCDGSDDGGCQADCQLMWKEAWLRRPAKKEERPAAMAATSKTRLDLHTFSQQVDMETGGTRYICQMTLWPRATSSLYVYDPRHWLRDLLSGNVRASRFGAGLAIMVFNAVLRRFGGARFPMSLPEKQTNSYRAPLDLRPGELVRIKSKREIMATLDARLKNRGLWF